jgi:arginine decarboxylase
MRLNHNDVPLLDAPAEYHRLGRYGCTPPGHRQGVGADPRAREVLRAEPFRSNVLVSSGLDDRSSSGGLLVLKEKLIGAEVSSDLETVRVVGWGVDRASSGGRLAGRKPPPLARDS